MYFRALLLPFLGASALHAQVRINEFAASSSDRRLVYDASQTPRMGATKPWYDSNFNYWTPWQTGTLPAGWGVSGISTNLQSALQNKSHTLYLRKVFTVTPGQAASTEPLRLTLNYNDGFVAYLNGVEVARANCGAPKQFMYFSQPAFNGAVISRITNYSPYTTANVTLVSGAQTYTLGASNNFLVSGDNLLAIEVHNSDIATGMHIDAGLTAGGTVGGSTLVSMNFNDGTGASKTHTNSSGSPSNSGISGTAAAGGWLATAPNPLTGSGWTNLTITAGENPTQGLAASGAMRYDIAQTGSTPNGAAGRADIYGKAVAMTGAWTAGTVTNTQAQTTRVRFRYQLPNPNSGFDFRLDPGTAPGGEANAIRGFPELGRRLDQQIPAQGFEDPATTFSTNAGGTLTLNTNGSWSNVNYTTQGGSVWAGGAAASTFAFRLIEDNIAGAGYGGSKGHGRLIVTDPANSNPDYWGATVCEKPIVALPADTATVVDLERLSFQMAVKVRSGESCSFWLEPLSQGWNQRLELGSVNGTGNWQLVRWELAGKPNAAAFIAGWNAATLSGVRVNIAPSGAMSATNTQLVAWDDPQILAWRDFDSALTDGTGSASFISALNTANSISFLPVFSKRGSQASESLLIDDFEIVYTGPLPGNGATLIGQGAAGGNWDYQIGLGEPSGGVHDPLLARGIFTVPEELYEDYDSPGESVDWIELFNETGSDVDISGWGFTDNASSPNKWNFPAGTIVPANGYKLVLADKRQLAQPPVNASYPHASFAISSNGGTLGIYNGTTPVSTLTYPAQTADQTWSRNASGVWGYGEGTPNAPNAAVVIPAVVADPSIFVMVSGSPVYGGQLAGPQTVTLTCPTAGAEIHYTTDGSTPTGTSTLYTAPFGITAPDAKTGKVIRARAFAGGSKPSNVKTATFLLDQDSRLKGVPAMVFNGDREHNFYAPHGIMTISGGAFTPDNAPSYDQQWSATSVNDYNIAMVDGDASEREANLEWFAPAGYYPGSQSLSQNVGIGLRLSWSPYSRPRGVLDNAPNASPIYLYDSQNKNSYNIFFRSDFGPDSSITYPFFPGYPVSKFKNMRLRAGKNDIANPFYVDELMRRSWIAMGNQGVKGAIVTNYVNGAYKGYYNFCERIRLPFYQEHFNSSNLWDVRYVYDWEEGDGIFYNTLYNQVNNPGDPNYNTAIATNYAVLAGRIDARETADYFLLNTYGSTWDWPGNNFAMGRERVAGPQGRFHWTVWDAEGAFGNQTYYNKQVDYNTLLNDLVDPTGNGNGDTDLAKIFRSFLKSPQWRRLFADRVQKMMFNGGPLDDRVPTSTIRAERTSLVNEITPLYRYANNSTTDTLKESFWNVWTNGGTLDSDVNGGARVVKSRRAYLLPTGNPGDGNYNAGWLRDPNQDGNTSDSLWPLTNAPVFSQMGGGVPENYNLIITHIPPAGNSATVYYTTNGLDPTTDAGGIEPTAVAYTAPVVLAQSVTVKSRVRNTTTSEWSPLTEATFQVSTVQPTAANLVIAEIQYNPVSSDIYEFIRIQNIGSSAVDLTKLSFTQGINPFVFATATGTGIAPFNVPLQAVGPGESVFVVKDIAGFRSRFGTSLDGKIAGTYGGANLSNGGERIKLDHTDGAVVTVIKDFTYYDDEPGWPISTDGDGPSLILVNPASNPNHNLPASWVASSAPGGLSGRVMNYAGFQSATWSAAQIANPAISGLTADPDGDGISNLLEYALNGNPLRREGPSLAISGTTTIGPDRFMTLTFSIRPGLTDVTIVPETSGDLGAWLANAVLMGAGVLQPDGSTRYTYRDVAPLGSSPDRHFMHVKVTSP